MGSRPPGTRCRRRLTAVQRRSPTLEHKTCSCQQVSSDTGHDKRPPEASQTHTHTHAHLDNESVGVGGLRLWGHVLLDGLAGSPHRHQDAGVGEDDDGAGQHVAKEEKANDVGQRRQLVVRSPPVDAAGGAVRFRPVMAPLHQGPHSKHRRVSPHSPHQETGVRRGELAS